MATSPASTYVINLPPELNFKDPERLLNLAKYLCFRSS